MAGSFSNSFALVKASADVLRLDKELMVFPMAGEVGYFDPDIMGNAFRPKK